jgi:hypothetical protein
MIKNKTKNKVKAKEISEDIENDQDEKETGIEKESSGASSPKIKDLTGSITATLDAIRSKFGDESIMKLGDRPKVNVNAIPTGL